MSITTALTSPSNPIMKKIPHKVYEYLHILNLRAREAYKDHLDSCPVFGAEPGRKYIKIVATHPNQRMVHSFVDSKTGDLYKPAGWAAPVKDFRFNLYTDMGVLQEYADIYGGYLYKGSTASKARV